MSDTIKRLTIEGFKSTRKLEEFELRSLNVLIGANGAGKSNFVGFFRLLRELIDQRLQLALATEGGADTCLYLGPKVTQRIVAKLYFGENGYEFVLVPTVDNRLVFAEEVAVFKRGRGTFRDFLGSGHAEAKIKDRKDEPGRGGGKYGVPHYVYKALSSWVVYHFHDTSPTAGVRRQGPINDNEILRPNAENLAEIPVPYPPHQPSELRKDPRCRAVGGPVLRRFQAPSRTHDPRPDSTGVAATGLGLSVPRQPAFGRHASLRLPGHRTASTRAASNGTFRRTRTRASPVRPDALGQSAPAGDGALWQAGDRLDAIGSSAE